MLFYFNFFQSHFSALSLFLEVIYNSLMQHIKNLIASAFKNISATEFFASFGRSNSICPCEWVASYSLAWTLFPSLSNACHAAYLLMETQHYLFIHTYAFNLLGGGHILGNRRYADGRDWCDRCWDNFILQIRSFADNPKHFGRRLMNVLRIAPRVCPIMHSRERYSLFQ